MDDELRELVDLLLKYPSVTVGELRQYGVGLSVLEALRAHDQAPRFAERPKPDDICQRCGKPHSEHSPHHGVCVDGLGYYQDASSNG